MSHSRSRDAGLDRYLGKEFRGGMPFEELRRASGPGRARATELDRPRVPAAVVRLVKAVLLNLRRVKPAPALAA